MHAADPVVDTVQAGEVRFAREQPLARRPLDGLLLTLHGMTGVDRAVGGGGLYLAIGV